MTRHARGLLLATAIGLIALSLLSTADAAAAAGGSPGTTATTGSNGTLTHQYPLGTQTLCCHSASSTTPSAGSAATPPQTATSTSTSTSRSTSTSASTSHRSGAAPAKRQSGGHGGTGALVLLALIPVVLLAAILRWLVARPTRGTAPRSRREVSPTRLRLLTPLFRRDHRRDAWILRGIGQRYGPVLRPRSTVRVSRRPDGVVRASGPDDRWSHEDELEREPPPLAIRPRSK